MEFKRIISMDTTTFIGMNFYGDPFEKASAWSEENEIGELWKRFSRYLEVHPDSIKNIKQKGISYEIHFQTEDTAAKGYFDVFAGVMTENADYIPLGCIARQLPPSKYAVITLRGNEIISDWGKSVFMEWLPASGYELSYNYVIQCYDEQFKDMSQVEQSELDLYIPIK
ncbi:MAG: GyrI-like domain-containing protein [Clostridia bacterium]|nr:GyrI-like domain-containing protein [Clostridia bacterium]